MLLGAGAEFREEAACSQCPGSSFLEMPVLCTSLPVAHLGYQKHKAFLFPPHLTILRRVPALGNVVLLQLDPQSVSGFLSLWEGCSSQCKGKVPKGKPVCRVIPDGPSQLAAGSSQLLLGKEGREQLSEGIAAALPNGEGSLGQETPAQQLLALLSCCCVCPMDGFFQWKRFPGDAVWRKSSPGGWQWEGHGKPSRAGLWGGSLWVPAGSGVLSVPNSQLLRGALPSAVLALPLLHSRRSPVVPWSDRQTGMQHSRRGPSTASPG